MKRFTNTPTGYKFDRLIFWGAIGLCVLLVLIVGIQENFNFKYYFYFECNKDVCQNPLMDLKIENAVTGYNYKRFCLDSWCAQPYLTRGVYGNKAPFILRNYWAISVSIIVLALILNHYIHNKGKKFDLTLNVPEKWKKKFKEMED